MAVDSIQIQPLRSLGEMQPVVELQRSYWGDGDDAVIPAHMLFSLAAHGGHVLAATDGDTLAGVVIGFLGTDPELSDRPALANLQIYSKRMVVARDYRNRGLGYRLKVAQRDFAMKQGVRLVTWTFDPLLAPNAHLNVRKLGVICRDYRENYYGTGGIGGLSTPNYSDRLFVEWWVTKNRVEERLFGERGDLTLAHYLEANAVITNPSTVTDDGFASPGPIEDQIGPAFLLVEVPHNFTTISRENPAVADLWREHMGEALGRPIQKGYVVTDFLKETYEGRERAFYLLSALAFDE